MDAISLRYLLQQIAVRTAPKKVILWKMLFLGTEEELLTCMMDALNE
jgi:hypothetical protein